VTFKSKPFSEKYMPVTESGCWLWTSGWDTDGYGLMTGNVKAHRASYEMYVGPIPAGMCVCHKCDTPPCVNPDHLFLGTQKENTADRTQKGRSCSGERHHRAKLNQAEVLDIITSSDSKTALSARYGVSRGMIGHIRAGRAWRSTVERIAAQAGVFIETREAA
jgi:hypothetical protein